MVIIFQKIKNTLEKEFYSLNLVCQEHYCLRMWRDKVKKEKYLKTCYQKREAGFKKMVGKIFQLKILSKKQTPH